MNTKNNIICLTLMMFCMSCTTIDLDGYYARATYMQNTLSYAIDVQCFYHPIKQNIANRCAEKNSSWSEPITIEPGETSLIMDYVEPDYINIYRHSDDLLLNNEYGAMGKYIGSDSNKSVVFVLPIKDIYYDSKYAKSAIDWMLIPIGANCEGSNSVEYRKNCYLSDGWAHKYVLALNPEAECFQ